MSHFYIIKKNISALMAGEGWRNQPRWGAKWAKNQKNVQKLKFSSEFIKLNFIKELMTTALPHKNSKFQIFPVLVESLIKHLYGKFPLQLEKIPIFFYKNERNFFPNISEKSFFTFLENFLESIKCHPPFSTVGRNSC
jgi:hypothetical protein